MFYFLFLYHLLLNIWEIGVQWGKGFITCFSAQLKAVGEHGLLSDTHMKHVLKGSFEGSAFYGLVPFSAFLYLGLLGHLMNAGTLFC